LGYTYADKGINLDEAISLIEKALEIEPEVGAYIDSLGWAYYKKGMIDKAIELLEKAVGYEDDPIIRDHLGDAYYKKGWTDKAAEQWEKSLKKDPGQEKVREKLERAKIDQLQKIESKTHE
jgi:tetratricopeptide (TPR) repeat protein